MTIINTIEQLAALATASTEVVAALQVIRDGYTDEAFERLEQDHPLVAQLLTAAVELEYHLERY